jgi:AcrR family transcriptional regulator
MLQSNNPLAQQSQRWIIQALLQLMENIVYDRISVSEICRKADLDRRTFYRNFNSKNDVLEQYINLLSEEYLKRYAEIDSSSRYCAAKFFFEFWNQNLCFIKNIDSCGLSDFVFKRFEKFAKEHRELLIGEHLLELPIEYVFAYRIGGFWNVLLTRVSNDIMLSPDEIASILSQI